MYSSKRGSTLLSRRDLQGMCWTTQAFLGHSLSEGFFFMVSGKIYLTSSIH
ncbi:hypothetical protein CPT_Spivey_154 [Klebsiella phage Spivey]|uniref:Uncharacterized protein n=1 Tax=Klebsiella phage Spivey TaxID=2562542 RepID=A0A4D5ZDV4_9CAUD|nr:hypothetical protein CPT_Spivey_052 [Klebsiella phage Spivey]